MALSNVQLLSLLVLIFAVSGALSAGVCRITVAAYYTTDCQDLQAAAPIYAADDECTSVTVDGTSLSMFPNCTANSLDLYTGAFCNSSSPYTLVNGGCQEVVGVPGWVGNSIGVTFGGSGSQLASWITFLTALFN